MALGKPLPPCPPLSPTLIGKPDETVMMPETCQPPKAVLTKRLWLFRNSGISDEIDSHVVSAIVATDSIVVFPSEIGVGHVGEVSAAASAGCRIDRARQSIESAQLQVALDL